MTTVALVATGCAIEVDPGIVESDDIDGTFVFGAAAGPSSLDPALASDAESLRITRQVFEGLVQTEPGTADPAPLLATEWEQSEDGLTYTFQLQDGVEFHDGTPFDAEAVCFNFDRLDALTGTAQAMSAPTWGRVMRGFAETGTSIYDGCEAVDEHEVTISLTEPAAEFLAALALPAFAMQSPTALVEFAADNIGGTPEAPILSEYAAAHPTGTGPFTFQTWEPGVETTLSAFEDYWGDQGQVREVVVTVVGDPAQRRAALESGTIDAFDEVGFADRDELAQAGYMLIDRYPLNLLYLGMDQAVPELADISVREAITAAVDKERLIAQTLPEGTPAAREFTPPSVVGYSNAVPGSRYDPKKARTLLAEAGFNEDAPLSLSLLYPSGQMPAFLPDAAAVADEIMARLSAVGIDVEPVPVEWAAYGDAVRTGGYALHLMGISSDYNDPDAFVGALFEEPAPEWGFTDETLADGLVAAREALTAEEYAAAYSDLNARIMRLVPGVPLAHPTTTLAFSPRVSSYPASPVHDEVYNRIVLAE